MIYTLLKIVENKLILTLTKPEAENMGGWINWGIRNAFLKGKLWAESAERETPYTCMQPLLMTIGISFQKLG